MPIYAYKCTTCRTEMEMNVPVDHRDDQQCIRCLLPLDRVIRFNGTVYAPTAGGMK